MTLVGGFLMLGQSWNKHTDWAVVYSASGMWPIKSYDRNGQVLLEILGEIRCENLNMNKDIWANYNPSSSCLVSTK